MGARIPIKKPGKATIEYLTRFRHRLAFGVIICISFKESIYEV